jgi:DsbC/DsbD-like thiol-disulfide interchange protein
MSRSLVLVALLAAACTKSAPKDNGTASDRKTVGDRVAVPGGDVPPPNMKGGSAEGAQTAPGGSDPQKLNPDEGKLAIESPADAKAGAETTAKITVTPASGYHVNTEFPIKLTLTAPDGVTLAKTEFKAGGPSKDKGDADTLEESQLLLGVKLTAAKSGSYTINGTFKFAVCDKDSCRPKKESIAIQVAAK